MAESVFTELVRRAGRKAFCSEDFSQRSSSAAIFLRSIGSPLGVIE